MHKILGKYRPYQQRHLCLSELGPLPLLSRQNFAPLTTSDGDPTAATLRMPYSEHIVSESARGRNEVVILLRPRDSDSEC